MKISQDLKCFIGLHKFEIINDNDEIYNYHGDIIGKHIISRCTNCGKIKVVTIYNNREVR